MEVYPKRDFASEWTPVESSIDFNITKSVIMKSQLGYKVAIESLSEQFYASNDIRSHFKTFEDIALDQLHNPIFLEVISYYDLDGNIQSKAVDVEGALEEVATRKKDIAFAKVRCQFYFSSVEQKIKDPYILENNIQGLPFINYFMTLKQVRLPVRGNVTSFGGEINWLEMLQNRNEPTTKMSLERFKSQNPLPFMKPFKIPPFLDSPSFGETSTTLDNKSFKKSLYTMFYEYALPSLLEEISICACPQTGIDPFQHFSSIPQVQKTLGK